MGIIDVEYERIFNEIMDKGTWDHGSVVRPRWVSDGEPAHSILIPRATISLDNSEVPLVSKKKTAWKSAIKEGPFWIWQEKSNSVDRLNEMGVHIWDDWRFPDGTIGKAYGYQLAKRSKKVVMTEELKTMLDNGFLSGADHVFNYTTESDDAYLDQVDYLLYSLVTNPASRRHITMLWNWDDIDGMALTPCVYETQWIVINNKLHLVVGIRSNDWALGNPFNVFQYYVLQRMIAQVTGYELGSLEFDIRCPHVYERHVDGLRQQMKEPNKEAPELWINPDVKSFYDFNMFDFELKNYVHGPKIEFEIAK